MHNLRILRLVLLFSTVPAITLRGDAAVPARQAGIAARQAGIPGHPRDIKYAELVYEVPSASQFREVLSNGIVVYIAEDRMLPTFDLIVTLRAGSVDVPDEKMGLASLTGEQMRDGGTTSMTPEELDERVEYLAASLSISISETRGRAGLSCLAKDIDEGLALLIETLRYPRFDEQRLRLAKDRRVQNIKRRNDSTATISRIEWGFLMNGRDHFSNRYTSSASLAAITRDDLLEFHCKYIHPGNMIVNVAGDFDRKKMLAKLEEAFADWPTGETGKACMQSGPTSFPSPDFTPKPGVYMIHKEDVNQGRVAIGHKGVTRGSPDEFPLQVMNGILGASGFRSRLVARIRSDGGLAYHTGSRPASWLCQFRQGVYYAGDFQCWFQSKSNSCAYATQIVLDEINRLRSQPVTQEDVDATVAYFVESFPQRFGTKMQVLSTYVSDEYTGRDPAYWQTYVRNLKRVTPADVQRVARLYLHPDELVILVVGDGKAVRAGGHDKAPNLRFDAFGTVTELPLRDPDTLER